MNQVNLRQISEKFIQLDSEKQKKVYEKMLSEGLEMSQFPIPHYAKTAESFDDTVVSYAQQRFWFLWQLDPSSSAYNISGAINLSGHLDLNAVNVAFDRLFDRHAVLRSVFNMDEHGVLRVKVQNTSVLIEQQNIDHNIDHNSTDLPVMHAETISAEAISTHTSGDARVQAAITHWVNQPFDLTQGSLCRICVFKLNDTDFVLALSMHHIISDGWSVQLLFEAFIAEYKAIVTGEAPEVDGLKITYADYAQWQRQWMQAGEMQRQIDYWIKTLGRDNPVLALPVTDTKAHQVLTPAKHKITLDAAYASQLRAYVTKRHASLFTLMLNTLQVLLYRYTGQQDIRVGVAVSGRERIETHSVIGLFVNTQVLRNKIEPKWTLSDAFNHCHEQVQGAQEFQQLPFDKLVEALNPERSLQTNPLFQVMFNFIKQQESPLENSNLASLPDLTISAWQSATDTTDVQFDLVLNITDKRDGSIDVTFIYAEALFNKQRIKHLAQDYQALLDAMLLNDKMAIGDTLSHQSAKQHYVVAHHQACYQELAAKRSFHSIPDLIKQQAMQHPDKTALVFYDEALTYQELEAQSDRLASHLQSLGVTTETKVGVLLERGLSLFVSLYGVLKSGGTYVPIDPSYPDQRIEYIIEDSGVQVLLTHSDSEYGKDSVYKADSVNGRGIVGKSGVADDTIACEKTTHITRLNIDGLDLTSQSLSDYSAPPVNDIHPDQLAYIIYTSGSTGKPKGVAVSHQSIVNHCHSIAQCYELTEQDVEFHFLSISFDGAQERWITPLISGASVVIRQQALQDIESIIHYLVQSKTTVVALPPSYLHQIVNWVKEVEGQPRHLGIKTYCFAGEAFSRELLSDVITYLKPEQIINGYGPTETVVTPMIWKETAATADFTSAYAPIGRLVGCRQAYILDNDLNIVPQGIAGELYLGGLLARGYLNRPDLTCERFIANPFGSKGASSSSDHQGSRLYRTGDLVRWNEQDQLEYLGRIDHQVKIRGYRIELGEIESAINNQAGVKQSVVVAQKQEQSARLVAYLVQQKGAALNTQMLQKILKTQLPDYMVPSIYVMLDKIPLNANGKVDRHALPEPKVTSLNNYEAPKNDSEKTLANIWQKVLKVERVGRFDNFFELGGDSITSLQLISIAKKNGFDMTLKDLFQRPTIANLLQSNEAQASMGSEAIIKLNQFPVSQETVNQAPLVCIHAVTGTIFDYLPLAKTMEQKRAVYAIASSMSDYSETTYHSLYDMAEHYAALLIDHSDITAYELVGWSIGGALALMIAASLEKRGYVVDKVHLVDTYAPKNMNINQNDTYQPDGQHSAAWQDSFIHYAKHIIQLPIELSDIKAIEDNRIEDGCIGISDSSSIGYERGSLPSIEDMTMLVEALRRSHHNALNGVYKTMESRQIASEFAVSHYLSQLARNMQTLEKINAPIEIFWASDRSKEDISRVHELLGIDLLAAKIIEADHFSILHNPSLLDYFL